MNRFTVGDIVILTEESLKNKSRWYYPKYYGDIGIIVSVQCDDYTVVWKEHGISAWFEGKDLKLIHKFDWSDYEKEQSTEKD